jgi:polyphosphate glucokinase
MAASTLGIDIGGTGIKAAPVNLATGEFAAERVKLDTPHPATPEAVAACVVESLAGFDATGRVGITLPAVVQHGIVRTATNIDHAWIGANAEDLFSQALQRPVTVLNDADAAGLAEMHYGAGTGLTGVVQMVTLGTGLGSALFVGGVLVPNTEFGHLRLHHHGDAEEFAAESARERDALSWKEWAHRLSAFLEELELLLWPDLFILGGGVSRRSDKFVPLLTCKTPVVPATLHNDAGIVGAAMVAAAGGE